MKIERKELLTLDDLRRAQRAQLVVQVRSAEDGQIMDYGGPIESITLDAVKINGFYFRKAVCRFHTR